MLPREISKFESFKRVGKGNRRYGLSCPLVNFPRISFAESIEITNGYG